MTREIRFRGISVDTGEWVYGDFIHGVGAKHGNSYILPVTQFYPKGCNDLDGWKVKPETVGQYTGKHDKNGVEVYQGDWLTGQTSFENYNDERVWTREEPCLVTWDLDYSGFLPFVLNARWRCDVENIEVIGSIHTHPELINK